MCGFEYFLSLLGPGENLISKGWPESQSSGSLRSKHRSVCVPDFRGHAKQTWVFHLHCYDGPSFLSASDLEFDLQSQKAYVGSGTMESLVLGSALPCPSGKELFFFSANQSPTGMAYRLQLVGWCEHFVEAERRASRGFWGSMQAPDKGVWLCGPYWSDGPFCISYMVGDGSFCITSPVLGFFFQRLTLPNHNFRTRRELRDLMIKGYSFCLLIPNSMSFTITPPLYTFTVSCLIDNSLLGDARWYLIVVLMCFPLWLVSFHAVELQGDPTSPS